MISPLITRRRRHRSPRLIADKRPPRSETYRFRTRNNKPAVLVRSPTNSPFPLPPPSSYPTFRRTTLETPVIAGNVSRGPFRDIDYNELAFPLIRTESLIVGKTRRENLTSNGYVIVTVALGCGFLNAHVTVSLTIIIQYVWKTESCTYGHFCRVQIRGERQYLIRPIFIYLRFLVD